MDFSSVKIETFIPEEFIEKLRDALNDIGALTVGNYDSCMAVSKVKLSRNISQEIAPLN